MDEPWPMLKVDNARKTDLEEMLVTLVVEEGWEGLYRCEATFRNWKDDGLLYDDRKLLEFGKPLQVELNLDGTSTVTIFDGRIMALEGRFPLTGIPMLAVLAEDRLQDLRMTRRTRSWEEKSDAEIMKEIIGDAGLTASVSVKGVEKHPLLVQMNQSDLAFVRERARAVDAEVWAEGSTVHVGSRSDRGTDEVTLTYGEELIDFTVLADLACQRSEVRVTGWDVTTKKAIASKVTDSVITAELGGLKSGSSVLTTALKARVEQVAHHHPVAEAEAKFLAEGTFRRLARRFLTGDGLADGNPLIKVGCKVKLEGLGKLFSGSYYVTEVRQMIDRHQGYRTQFRVERPGIGG